MANKMSGFFSFVALLSLLFSRQVLGLDIPMAGPACSDVIPKVTFCLLYITGGSPSPSDACCNGIKTVASIVKDKNDAVLVCNCLKNKLVDLQYQPSLIASLSDKCSVSFKLPPISKATDCSKVNPPYFMMSTNQAIFKN